MLLQRNVHLSVLLPGLSTSLYLRPPRPMLGFPFLHSPVGTGLSVESPYGWASYSAPAILFALETAFSPACLQCVHRVVDRRLSLAICSLKSNNMHTHIKTSLLHTLVHLS